MVRIFPEKFRAEYKEGTFETDVFVTKYILTTDKRVQHFIMMRYYYDTKTSPIYGPYQFAEDLTEAYKSAYLNVERVYTSQIISTSGY